MSVGIDPAIARLDRDHAHHLLEQMLRIRRFEEKCAELYSATKIRGFLHLYIGEEAIATGVMEALRPEDSIVATYREHGHALTRGIPMQAVMAEMFGKLQGTSRGRGGSMHIFDRAANFVGGNAIVGGGIPMAVGLAMADKMLHRCNVTACFFGEGAMDEGEFHESINLAALWDLPVLFCVENNQYSMGNALRKAESQLELTLKAASYEVPAWSVDGMDVLAVEEAARRAVDAVRHGCTPYFLEFKTYRFRAHSMYDPDLYRPKEEIERWKQRDPIETFETRLRAAELLDDSELDAIESRIASELDEAIAYAEAGDLEPVEELERFVYSEVGT